MKKPIIIVQTKVGYWAIQQEGVVYVKKIAEVPAENQVEADEIVIAHNSRVFLLKGRGC